MWNGSLRSLAASHSPGPFIILAGAILKPISTSIRLFVGYPSAITFFLSFSYCIRSAENAEKVTLIQPASLLVLPFLRDPWYFREPVSQKRNIRSSVVPRNDYHPVQQPGENFLLFPNHHSRIPSTEYRLPNTELRIPFSPNPRLRLSHLRAIMRSTFGLTHPHQDDKLIFLSPYPPP